MGERADLSIAVAGRKERGGVPVTVATTRSLPTTMTTGVLTTTTTFLRLSCSFYAAISHLSDL